MSNKVKNTITNILGIALFIYNVYMYYYGEESFASFVSILAVSLALFLFKGTETKQWLKKDYVSAATTVQDYEQFNFGDITTRFDNPEAIANMLNYIFGEEILSDSKIYNCLGGRLYEKLSSFTLDLIIRELRLKLN